MTLLQFFDNKIPETVTVRVTPKASRNEIKFEQDDRGHPLLKIYLTIAAEEGKANHAAIKMLAKAFGLPQGRFEILTGHTSRHKIIKIHQM